MVKKDFKILHYVENLKEGIGTPFLLPLEVKQVKSKLKGIKVNVYKPYKDSEKVLIYTNQLVGISLFQIISPTILQHREIMGALMNLGVDSSCFGDIIVLKDRAYFYSLTAIDDEINTNLNKISRYSVKVKKVPLEELSNYEREYSSFTFLSSSLRLDKIVSLIAKTNREKACLLIKNKEVTVNYEIITKPTYNLKEDDILSIHRIGKFKFLGVKGMTKNNKIIGEYIKYI